MTKKSDVPKIQKHYKKEVVRKYGPHMLKLGVSNRTGVQHDSDVRNYHRAKTIRSIQKADRIIKKDQETGYDWRVGGDKIRKQIAQHDLDNLTMYKKWARSN